MELANNYTVYFKQQSVARICWLILGTLLTWAFLINLLQVNFDVGEVSLFNKSVEISIMTSQKSQFIHTSKSKLQPILTRPHQRFDLFAEESPAIEVAEGDDLEKILHSYEIPEKTIKDIEILPLFYNFAQHLEAGKQLQVVAKNGNLETFIYPISKDQILLIHQDKNGLQELIEDQDLTDKVIESEGTVEGSFYAAAHRAGLDKTMVMNLIKIFGPEIDFKKAIYSNDKFKVLYIESYKNDEPIKSGPILAAEITVGGKQYIAVRNVDPDGRVSYYNENGQNTQKAFLRTPLRYEYISSPFNLHRMHPILHFIRPHYGVDLVAPVGTPIVASSDGVVRYMGRMGGYGNVIVIRNSCKYSTRYAHLEKFAKNLHRGSFVTEGQVIGYVGETGLSTGPHLHYEFRIDGKPVNPMTAKLPQGKPIAESQKPLFLEYVTSLEKDNELTTNKLRANY